MTDDSHIAIASVTGLAQHDLLRARLEAALQRYAPSTQRAYIMGLNAFDGWFRRWVQLGSPTAIRNLLAMPCRSLAAGWWPTVSMLMQSGPLVTGTVVEHYVAAGCTNKATATTALRVAAVKWPFRIARQIGAISWDLHVARPRVMPYRDVSGPGVDAVRRMMKAAKETSGVIGARDLSMLALLYARGLRRSELSGLDVADFDRAGRRLRIRGKGRADHEWISIPEQVCRALERYLTMRGSAAGTAPLFQSHDRAQRGDGRLSPHGLYQRVAFLARQADIAVKVSPHRIRHTSITTALDRTGGDLRGVQAFARHGKADTTTLYDDRRRDVAGEVADVLAGMLGDLIHED